MNLEAIKKMDLSSAILVDEEKKSPVSSNSATAVLSIVNHRCGKRITFSRTAYEQLGKPVFIRLLLKERFIIIEKGSVNDKGSYALSVKDKKKPILYGDKIVQKVTSYYGLDFTNRSTISFDDGQDYVDRLYVSVDGKPLTEDIDDDFTADDEFDDARSEGDFDEDTFDDEESENEDFDDDSGEGESENEGHDDDADSDDDWDFEDEDEQD